MGSSTLGSIRVMGIGTTVFSQNFDARRETYPVKPGPATSTRQRLSLVPGGVIP